eukprot:GILK01001108.1.p1 GENE.GILK01001108.1~~GILK01001108.1.p1  ORF type:complete len:265 (-),score=52.86 GILK01001108.1:113-859(-)
MASSSTSSLPSTAEATQPQLQKEGSTNNAVEDNDDDEGSRKGSDARRESISGSLDPPKNRDLVLKVGLVGDSQVGKTSLMVKYVENHFNEDYVETLGVSFMEKRFKVKNTDIICSIWDLGGQREFIQMLPLVCNEAVAILFMFDLSRKNTLASVREWHRQSRMFNKTAVPFLIGTKYDFFASFPREEQEEITQMARKFAKAMKAPLIFCSVSYSINIQKIFKIVVSKVFDLKCSVPKIEKIGDPIIEY